MTRISCCVEWRNRILFEDPENWSASCSGRALWDSPSSLNDAGEEGVLQTSDSLGSHSCLVLRQNTQPHRTYSSRKMGVMAAASVRKDAEDPEQ